MFLIGLKDYGEVMRMSKHRGESLINVYGYTPKTHCMNASQQSGGGAEDQ